MNKKVIALTALCCFISLNVGFAATNYSYESTQTPLNNNANYEMQPLQYQNKPLQGSVVLVPSGTSVPAMLTTPLSSANMTVGQRVSMVLSSDFYYNNKLIAPLGSTVVGTVIEASGAKHGSMNGKLCVRFTQINTPYGNQIPISALIKTDDGTGVLMGGTKMDVTKEYAKDVAVGSASGALTGLVFGALSGGDVGKGAALGAAIGAGGGLTKSVWDKGVDVEIPANACVDLILTQPITTTVTEYSYEN